MLSSKSLGICPFLELNEIMFVIASNRFIRFVFANHTKQLSQPILCHFSSFFLQHELMEKGKLIDRKNANLYIVLTGKKSSGRACSSLLGFIDKTAVNMEISLFSKSLSTIGLICYIHMFDK